MLARGIIKDVEHELLIERVKEQQKAKTRSRKSLQKGGQLTVNEARHKIAEKQAKERAKDQAKKERNWRILRNAEKAELHKRGVTARKAERERKKELLRLQTAKLSIPSELLFAIPDPEKQAAKQTESDDGFIRFDDDTDEIDSDDNIAIGLFEQ